MNVFRTTTSSIGLLLVVVYAVGAGLWTSTGDGWYQSLHAPTWQPPDWVFGIIWPYNFIVIGISAAIVSQRLSQSLIILWLISFALSVFSALLWAYSFYRPHNLEVATIALAAAAIFTIPLLVITYRASIPLLICLVPYQVWLITATFLSWGYQKRN